MALSTHSVDNTKSLNIVPGYICGFFAFVAPSPAMSSPSSETDVVLEEIDLERPSRDDAVEFSMELTDVARSKAWNRGPWGLSGVLLDVVATSDELVATH